MLTVPHQSCVVINHQVRERFLLWRKREEEAIPSLGRELPLRTPLAVNTERR